MRLSRIKLAGFKSFVDPTDLKLPSQLVGVVGPNGCGKSNTIDAVRWVMGESSAKHLRGESMEDVIFTGSRSRKPVGQASVELVFDNSDGSLGGEYAAFGEISIRREVTRDGQSKYALNNVRCRRRDIRDIFLGTGLGPRSYAIIEQGMISRLIEAKPEDLRVYLEEAAGISKYKERRRETETRIRHTRDNLDRLEDLREEVDKQLAHLKRQARTAERYQEMRAEERQKRGELLVLRRRDFQARGDAQALAISEREAELEGIVAELRASESALELARTQQSESSDRFSVVQADFYRVGADVARIEQSIEHTRDSRRQQSRELAEVDRELAEAEEHRRVDTARVAEIVAALETDEPGVASLQETQKVAADALQQAERSLQEWQQRHEAFRTRQQDAKQRAELERSRLDQLERSRRQAAERMTRLQEEQGGLDVAPLAALISAAIAEEVGAAAEEGRLKQSLEDASGKQQLKREAQRQLDEELNEARTKLQSGLGRLASLEALQQAALEPDHGDTDAWLHLNELDDQPRVAQSITVAPGWEKAVELVLGPHLEAVCVDGDAVIERCLKDLPAAELTLVQRGSAAAADTPSGGELLASKIDGELPLGDLLGKVLVAENIAEALARRTQLGSGESVVTRDGLWLGRSWLRVARAASEDSVLLRETAIADLRDELQSLEVTVSRLDAELQENARQLSEQETQRDTLLHSFNDAVRHLSTVRSGLQSNRQKEENTAARLGQLNHELSELQAETAQAAEELAGASERRATALAELETMQADADELELEQQQLREAHVEARRNSEQQRDAGQELAVRVESMRSTRAATEQNLTRMQARITQLSERQTALNSQLAAEDEDPLIALEAGLQQHLESRQSAEAALATSRDELNAIDGRLREHEQARQRHDARASSLRDTVQELKLDSQEVLVRLKTLDEQLAEHEYTVASVMETMPAEATLEQWGADLEALEARMKKLGPINLAAIDELAEQNQRKAYLDEQHADVTEALATLERAIAKIDRETRSRFKDTFDKVNAKVEEFFPRLFGGGQASLEMTGDDLLSTGVSVVAQPPGKRVSNIQLLSGGEKALTAVALVFAFFELNPSPFCMLDEVDAPLDDANVGRFCALVREMSERVQFIFITHNKITMEMAQQLMGVTMNEPGVSRLVAVDVQEAAELAGV